MRRALLAAACALAACRGEPPRAAEGLELARLVDSLAPSVERATGLRFARLPRAVVISREQARGYLLAKFREQFPGERARDLTRSYQLLGLLPDTLDLGRLLLDVLTEQVAGYYEPDSQAFFGVANADPVAFRVTVAHELVHALQHDHVALDSILDQRDDADRLAAAQAVLEGQATLAMIRMQPTVGDRALEPAFWEQFREGIAANQSQMAAFARAPRVLRESLLFPYVEGSEYMRWWVTAHPAGEQPYGARMPRSTEQILAPERAARGDVPLRVTIAPVAGATAVYGDVLGAAELRILLATAEGREGLADAAVLGWGGDRYALYRDDRGDALVWVGVFDNAPARARAERALAHWPPARAGYRTALDPLEVSGRPGLRLVVAPAGWAGWPRLPGATAAPEE